MRGADAPSGKDIIVLDTGFVDGVDDDIFDIGNHPGVAYLDAPLAQRRGDVIQVNVLGTSGEDLVTDYEHGRGYRLGHSA